MLFKVEETQSGYIIKGVEITRDGIETKDKDVATSYEELGIIITNMLSRSLY